jgi:hypothetical protein
VGHRVGELRGGAADAQPRDSRARRRQVHLAWHLTANRIFLSLLSLRPSGRHGARRPDLQPPRLPSPTVPNPSVRGSPCTTMDLPPSHRPRISLYNLALKQSRCEFAACVEVVAAVACYHRGQRDGDDQRNDTDQRPAALVIVRNEETRAPINDLSRVQCVESRLKYICHGGTLGTRMVWANAAAINLDRRLHQLLNEHEESESHADHATTIPVQEWGQRRYSVVTVRCRDRPKLLPPPSMRRGSCRPLPSPTHYHHLG